MNPFLPFYPKLLIRSTNAVETILIIQKEIKFISDHDDRQIGQTAIERSSLFSLPMPISR